MDKRLYPLLFEPEFRAYIWGGRNLEKLYGRALPPGRIAESWEVSGHASSPTRVANGCWKGRTLPEVLDALGLDLVGRASQAALDLGRFPLLVKLLDANRPLSVQVHPSDEYALVHENGELGKTEMWYVLHAETGAELVYGLAQGTTREAFADAIRDGTLEKHLHRLAIGSGDTVMVPAGTVHALLEGAVVAEVQQNSDTTYRVYDWGRTGDDGKPRPLHIDKALQVIDWTRIAPDKVQPTMIAAGEGIRRFGLVRNDKFTVEKAKLADGISLEESLDGETFAIWGCVEGGGTVEFAGDSVPLSAVQFTLLSAAMGKCRIVSRGESTWLRVYVES